jgi:hypothetical protein
MTTQAPQAKEKIINIAVLLIMAALINAWSPDRHPDSYGWNTFSYFTVLSNFIAAAVYIIAAIAIIRRKALGAWFGYLRGAAVLYMLITGLVYTFLLQNNPDANPVLGFDWKNSVLHQFGPIFIMMWWLLWPSKRTISPLGSLIWLAFPIVWLVYTYIRAAVIGWYPYPFLDPEKVGGIGGVAVYVVGITLGFVLLGQGLAWISRQRARNTSLY